VRLASLAKGQGLGAKFLFGMIRLMTGHRAPDVVRAIKYRGELWGTPFSALAQQVMRGPSAWSVGERELFAAFVSHTNQCPF
jgi:hypothetical protein